MFQLENLLEVKKLKTTTCSVARWLRRSSGRSSRNFITFPPCARKLCPFDRHRTRTPISYSGFDSSLGSFAHTHISNHQQRPSSCRTFTQAQRIELNCYFRDLLGTRGDSLSARSPSPYSLIPSLFCPLLTVGIFPVIALSFPEQLKMRR